MTPKAPTQCDPRDEALGNLYAEAPPKGGEMPPPATNRRATALRFIPLSEIADQIGPADWQIRKIVEANTIVSLYAPPDTFKSFLALDWALNSAIGRAWCGYKVKRGPVLALIGEGRNGYMRRIRAWCLHNEIDPEAIPIHISNTPAALTSEMGRAELEAVVAEFGETFGMPVLVLVDTLARNFGPGDESSTRDMGAAIDTCASIRDMTGAAVVLIHHTGKDAAKGARGSSALVAGADAEYSMSREPDGTVRLECRKMKDAPKPLAMVMRFLSVDLGIVDDEDEPVTSGVLVEAEEPTRTVAAVDKRNEVRRLKAQGKTVDQIAELTGIPRGTVGRHFTAINKEAEEYQHTRDGD